MSPVRPFQTGFRLSIPMPTKPLTKNWLRSSKVPFACAETAALAPKLASFLKSPRVIS